MGDFLFYVWWYVMFPGLALVFGIALVFGNVVGMVLIGLFAVVAFAFYALAASHAGETPVHYFVAPIAGIVTGVTLAAAGRTLTIVVVVICVLAAPLVLPLYIARRSAREDWSDGEQDDVETRNQSSRVD